MSNSTRESLAAKLREIADSNSDLFDTERDDLRSAADALTAAAAPVAQGEAIVEIEVFGEFGTQRSMGWDRNGFHWDRLPPGKHKLYAAPASPAAGAERLAELLFDAAMFGFAAPRSMSTEELRLFAKREANKATAALAPPVDAPAQQPEPAVQAAQQADGAVLTAQRKFDRDLFDAEMFYAALKRAVDARRVKWKDVAAATGVSTTTLSRMASGRQPDAASLAALSAWAGINPANYCPPVLTASACMACDTPRDCSALGCAEENKVRQLCVERIATAFASPSPAPVAQQVAAEPVPSGKVSKWIPTTNLMMLRRMGKMSEELGELQAVAARVIIQGIDEVDPSSGKVNRQRLQDEMADVNAQLQVTAVALGLDTQAMNARTFQKIGYMNEWEAMFADDATQPPAQPAGEPVDGAVRIWMATDPVTGGTVRVDPPATTPARDVALSEARSSMDYGGGPFNSDGEEGPERYTLDEIAHACMAAEVPDSKFESISIALQEGIESRLSQPKGRV